MGVGVVHTSLIPRLSIACRFSVLQATITWAGPGTKASIQYVRAIAYKGTYKLMLTDFHTVWTNMVT